jgi:hypothetical protein
VRRLLPLLMLTGCVISPLPERASPTPQVICPPIPTVPKPVWPDACVEDWYAKAELPACVKDWVLDVRDQQKNIATKSKK